MKYIDGTAILNYLQPLVEAKRQERRDLSLKIRETKYGLERMEKEWQKIYVECKQLEDTIAPIQVAQSMQNAISLPVEGIYEEPDE